MSNVHHLRGGDAPRPGTRARGPYRKSATKAEITRAVRAVEELGHTVYGLVVDGPRIQVLTRPIAPEATQGETLVDDWFSRHG